MQEMRSSEREELSTNLNGGKKGYYGFKGRAFPLLGFIVGLGSIMWTYYVAVTKSPPDVKPFPQTDITHTAIHFPEYVIFRIGMMVAPVILAITFQLLKYPPPYPGTTCRSSLSKSLDMTSPGWSSSDGCPSLPALPSAFPLPPYPMEEI